MMQDELAKEQAYLEYIKTHISHAVASAKNGIKQTKEFTEIVLNTVLQNQSLQLEKSRSQPYFSKLVFSEQTANPPNNSDKTEELYIGRFGLFDRETLSPYVIDWRSPIANLYYEDSFEAINIKVEHGYELTFDVHLKRQFDLKDGHLVQFFDSTQAIRTNEPLIERLRAKSEDRLKDIVETIQADQNRIIRSDPYQVLVVQGVAGSGKTTIALHRLSYLAYQHKHEESFNRFLIVGPNQLFIDYISDVLPNLGVEGVRQTTWESLLHSYLPKKVRITSQHKKIHSLYEIAPTDQARIAARASLLRGHLAMKELIDRYVNHLEHTAIPDEDFALDRNHVMTRDEISRKFHHDFAHYPYVKRRERLLTALKQWTADCLQTIATNVEKQSHTMSYTAMDEHIAKYKVHYERKLQAYNKKVKTADIFTMYRTLLTSSKGVAWLLHHSGHKDWIEDLPAIVLYYKEVLLSNHTFEWEDLGGLFYLTARLHGLEKHKPFSHIIVDEAQDLGVFQLYVLRLLCNQDALSIFGDLSQSIYAFKGLTAWRDIPDELFSKPVQFEVLQRSYRSTIEIMNLANHVLQHVHQPDQVLAIPVLRHGEKPCLTQWSSRTEALTGIAKRLTTLQNDGLHNIAIISKTAQECTQVGKWLASHSLSIHVISGKETHYEGGISVVPIYFSKGMEFDAVILLNPTNKHYVQDSPIDIKLLYVAMTRALHRLYIDSWEPLSELISTDSTLLSVIEP